jgi:hypothetical protein
MEEVVIVEMDIQVRIAKPKVGTKPLVIVQVETTKIVVKETYV